MKENLQSILSPLPLGGLRFFNSLGSTNDEALAWANEGSQDLSLVVADEQTAGRGRSGRKWFTPSGAALACSLILIPGEAERIYPSRMTGMVALAMIDALESIGCRAQIKWPNDILIKGRKVAGILVESVWTGAILNSIILGLGVNVCAESVPPADQLLFPATCIEAEVGHLVSRFQVLKEVISSVIHWRTKLAEDEILHAWEDHLAFRGRQVQISQEDELPIVGTLTGLESEGSLCLMVDSKLVTVQFGEVHLRPIK